MRFVVHNDDPIHHEFIVGDADVHARHADRHGAAAPAGARRGVGRPGRSGLTFYEFPRPGTVVTRATSPATSPSA